MKNFLFSIACVISASLGILLLAGLAGGQEGADAAQPPSHLDITGRLALQRNLTTFASAVRAAGLEGMLRDRGPLTVFAPDNAAFAKLPARTRESLLAPLNKKRLASVLRLHFVDGAISAKDLKPGELKTGEGAKIRVRVEGASLTYGPAKVVAADLQASNGIIHIIDTVVVPD